MLEVNVFNNNKQGTGLILQVLLDFFGILGLYWLRSRLDQENSGNGGQMPTGETIKASATKALFLFQL